MLDRVVRKVLALAGRKSPAQPNWHEDFIVHLASVMRPHVYLELGLYRCELFNRVAPYAQRSIGVDIAPEAGSFMRRSAATQFIHATSESYAQTARSEGLAIDLLFIDANHSYQSVHEDFANYFPIVGEQGIILLHDGFPMSRELTAPGYCGDGYRAIAELTAKHDGYEMMTIPVHPGLTIARKRTNHLPWA
jgi:predicted O-methyltransferase YrrM